ncbi:hypothetical protein LTR22_022676, partial [Elasticomyces elasticus]
CDKLRIKAGTKSARHNALRDYICNALLGKLAPYYRVRNAQRPPSPVRVSHPERLTDMIHNDKFTWRPIDWSEYDRLDIWCFAVHTILTTIQDEPALAQKNDSSMDTVSELPRGLSFEEEVSLAYS